MRVSVCFCVCVCIIIEKKRLIPSSSVRSSEPSDFSNLFFPKGIHPSIHTFILPSVRCSSRQAVHQPVNLPIHPSLFSVPHLDRLLSCDLLLELQNPVQQCLCRWRAPRHVNVHRDDPVAATDHCIRVVVVPTTVCTTPHRNHPPRFRHLVVHFPEGRCHFVCQRACNNHNVRLPWRRPENDAVPIHIVPLKQSTSQSIGT